LIHVTTFDNYIPSIVLDNLALSGVHDTVVSDQGTNYLSGGSNLESWGMGRKYTVEEPKGGRSYGHMTPPRKDPSLLKDGKWYSREKPIHTGSKSFLFTRL
jgi:hypothetical protein